MEVPSPTDTVTIGTMGDTAPGKIARDSPITNTGLVLCNDG